MSLRGRLVLAATYLLGVVVVALEVPLALTIRDSANQKFEAGVVGNAALVASRINDDVASVGVENPALPRPLEAIQRIGRDTAARTGARFVVVDARGRVLADSANQEPVGTLFATPQRPEFAQALAVQGGQIFTTRRRSDTAGEELLIVAVPVVHNRQAIGVVRATVPLGELNRQILRGWAGLGLIGLVVILVGLTLAWFLAGSLARPVERLTVTAQRLGHGDLDARATPEGPREVAMLGGTFNQMAGALAANLSAQRDFVANASHQLRTPLTGIRLRLEAIQGEGGFPADQAQKAQAEVDRLAGLVEDLLELARASSVESPGRTLNLADVVREAADRWSGPASETGKSLSVGVCDPCEVWADPEDVGHVLDNLIENALRYTPEGTAILVEARNGGRPSLVVSDDGPGIPAQDRDRIFERFYRGSTGRRGGPGTGLGLAIVAELVRRWGGEVSLKDGEGTRIEASFPSAATVA